MSYPYPQDRNRDRREKGEQPYEDARKEMAETDALIQNEAEAAGEARHAEHEADQARRTEQAATDRLREVGQELRELEDDRR